MLGRLEKFSHSLSKWFEWVGAAGILIMMFATCIDVAGAKLFLHPFTGAFDIVVLSQLLAVVFAAAIVLISGRHVQVEFFVSRLSRRAQAVISCITHLLALALFNLIVWRCCLYGYELQSAKEVTAEIQIPLFPFAYAIAFASIPVCLVLVVGLLRSIAGVVKR